MPKIISGGQAIAYWSALTIVLSRSKKKFESKDPLKDGEGVKIYVAVKKNHCLPDRNPYVRCEYYAVFGQGTEQILEALTVAESKGMVDIRGAWVYWYDKDGNEKQKWNGRTAFRQYMLENKDEWQAFMSQLMGQERAQLLSSEEIEQIKAEDKAIGEAVIDIEALAMTEEEVAGDQQKAS